eukprot:11211472-Lingulodinium_polyedra.AAC.1
MRRAKLACSGRRGGPVIRLPHAPATTLVLTRTPMPGLGSAPAAAQLRTCTTGRGANTANN